MNSMQALRNAIYEVKFAQLPGTHDNGHKRKNLSVDQALDMVARRMGLQPISVRPLYEINWNRYKLYSSVTGLSYEIVPEKDSARVIVKYKDEWHHHDCVEDAIDFVARQERGTYV